MACYIKVLWHLMEESGLYWALWTAAGVQSRGSRLSSGNMEASAYSHPQCTIYFCSLEVSPHKLILHWFIKFWHTWRMFASLLKKKTKHPTLLHIEYLVLRTCSEKCSKLKENKRKYFSKKYQGNVPVECLPRKGEALNLISQTGVVAHTCNPRAAGEGGRAIRSSRSSSITKLVQG